MQRIFVVEDQESIRKMLLLHLRLAGYEGIAAEDGGEAQRRLNTGEHFDLALVDVMLPVLDGFSLMPLFRERGIPVIFLTARGDLEAKLEGLTGGAEDYIVKPFEMAELLVRMEKVLLRTATVRQICINDVAIDLVARTVWVGGVLQDLRPMEFDLLLVFVRNRNVALSRERLLNEVWGLSYEGGTRTVDVHVAQLRKKTRLDIASVPKIGYRLEVGQ